MGFQHFRGLKEALDCGSEAPRLDPIEILERICGDYFVSGKLTVQKPKLNARFQPCELILSCFTSTFVAIFRYIVLFVVGKPADKIGGTYNVPSLSEQMKLTRSSMLKKENLLC